MLRARILALACLAIIPSMQAMAEDDQPNSKVAAAAASDSGAVTTDTESGTTTYFGGDFGGCGKAASRSQTAAASEADADRSG